VSINAKVLKPTKNNSNHTSDVYARPFLPINWNYQANWNVQPFKIPIVAASVSGGTGSGVAVTKTKNKQVTVVADEPENADEAGDGDVVTEDK
jgi:hypothetical protein